MIPNTPELEEWKPVEDFDGYEVSNMGRVRSITRLVAGVNGTIRVISGRIKKPTPDKHGYLTIWVCGNGFKKLAFVHQLVAQKFCAGPRKPTVDHVNGKRDDNRASNLEWATNLENTERKLTRLVRETREFLKAGGRYMMEVAK